MEFADVNQPEPGEDQILIKVHSTSVNRPDVMQRQGNYAPPRGESEILGLEVAGTVERTGKAVTRWNIGDKVMALIAGGGYAEYATAYQHHVMPVPASLSFHQAACVCETYITAYLNVFLLGGLTAGQRVLLHGGGGGVNTAAIQLCNQLAEEIEIFVTCSPGKLDRVKALGVNHVIDYVNQSFAEEIKRITANRGVDVILDHLGASYLDANMRSLAIGGKLLLIGVMGGIKSELNLALMMVKRQQIIGSVLRPRPVDEKASIIDSFSKNVLPLFEDQSIAPLVSDIYPLEQAAQAHIAMESSKHFGKIVLEVYNPD